MAGLADRLDFLTVAIQSAFSDGKTKPKLPTPIRRPGLDAVKKTSSPNVKRLTAEQWADLQTFPSTSN